MASKQACSTLDQQVSDYLLTASGHLKESKAGIDVRQAAAYGAAASSALVMMSQAEASVVHNAAGTLSPPVTVAKTTFSSGTSYVNFDINGDSTNDFALFGYYYTSSDSSYFGAGINGTVSGNNNSVLGSGNVRKLSYGNNIGPTNTSWQTASGTARKVFYNSGSGTSGWSGNNGETGFAGVRFKIGGNTHYGWIKLQLNAAGSLTATEWAYESCPDTPINAGQTTGGVNCNTPAAIPTMGLPALGLMGLALGGIGLAGLRRRRQEPRRSA